MALANPNTLTCLPACGRGELFNNAPCGRRCPEGRMRGGEGARRADEG